MTLSQKKPLRDYKSLTSLLIHKARVARVILLWNCVFFCIVFYSDATVVMKTKSAQQWGKTFILERLIGEDVAESSCTVRNSCYHAPTISQRCADRTIGAQRQHPVLPLDNIPSVRPTAIYIILIASAVYAVSRFQIWKYCLR